MSDKKSTAFYIYSSYLFIAIFLLFGFTSGQMNLSVIFNSDSIYLASLYEDVFIKGGKFSSWHLTPAPYFFPDMLVFFIIHAITQNTFYTFIVFAVLQAIATLFLSLWLQKEIIGRQLRIVLPIAFMLATALLFLSDVVPYTFMVWSGFHFGTLVNGLLLLIVATITVRKKSILGYFLLFIISGIATATDLLFFVTITAPLLATLTVVCLIRHDYRMLMLFISFIITGAIIGLLTKSLITLSTNSGYILQSVDQLHSHIQRFVDIGAAHFKANLVASAYTALFYIVALYQLTCNLWKRQFSAVDSLRLFILLSLISTVSAIIINGVLIDEGGFRYFISVYLFPIVFAWLPFYEVAKNREVNNRLATVVTIALGFSLLAFCVDKRITYTEYYPEIVSCVDRGIERGPRNKDKVFYGIAQYWHAKLINEFAKSELYLNQYKADLTPFIWINNPDNYRDVYDFAVVPHVAPVDFLLDRRLIEAINGPPAYTFECENATVLVYQEDGLRVDRVRTVGDSFTWRGCDLPTRIGHETEDCHMLTTGDQVGHLSFGPYEPLPAGKYHFVITYESDSSKQEQIGSWDVVSTLSGDTTAPLVNGMLNGTASRQKTIEGEFVISDELAMTPVEIRTLLEKPGRVALKSITVQKVG